MRISDWSSDVCSSDLDLATVVGTGTGMNVAEFAEKIGKPLGLYGDLYKLVMHHVMTALGYTVTSCTERREPVLAENPVHCLMLDRELAPGNCIGTRTIVDVETAAGIPGVAHLAGRPPSHQG